MKSAFNFKLAKISLLMLGILVSGFSHAQVISGKITDEKTGEALPFANVFINNTTLGSTSDVNGNFRITGVLPQNLEVVASFVGYFTKYRKVSLGGRNQVTVNFQLTPKEDQLSEITLKAKRDKRWERNLKKFKQVFLAIPNDPFFKKNEILNPWVIDFAEGKSGGSKYLLASASDPIKVSNMALGYDLDYHLQEFIQTRGGFHYFGLVNFHEKDSLKTINGDSWEESRNTSYFGSLRHFLHSLIRNEADKHGYRLYRVDSFPQEKRTNDFNVEIRNSIFPLPFDSLMISQLPNGNYTINWPKRIEIHYLKKVWTNDYYVDIFSPISWITAPDGYFEFDEIGIPVDPKQIVLSGYMGRHRVGRFLPYDFVPSPKYLAFLSEIDSSQLNQTKWDNLREKPYLTFNKPYYSPGETAWFNSRMLYQNPFLIDTLSRVLYVDLINEKNEVVNKEIFPIQEGSSKGQIQLGADLPTGNYTVRAYTNWMKSYPISDVFYKPIPIIRGDREVVSAVEFLTNDQSSEDVILKMDTVISRMENYNRALVSLSILDSDSSLLQGDFSISLIDADLATFVKEETNIESAMEWLGSDLADFDSLINMTKIEYGISVEGYFSDRKNKPLAVPLTIVQGQMEDYGIVKSDSTGYFWATGLYFSDSADVAIAALNKNRKSFGQVSLIQHQSPEVPIDLPKLQLETRPKSKIGKLDIFEGDYFELEEFTLEGQKQQTMAEKNYGYGEGDRSIGTEILERFPQHTLDQIIPMNMSGGLMGNYNWGLSAGEPLLMIDGNRYFTDAGESIQDVLKTFIAADVESIEIFTFSAVQFGMAGFAGVIMVNTKRGSKMLEKSNQVFNSDEFQIFKVKGFSPVREFPVQKLDSEIPESRPTIYWNPNVETNRESGTFSFSVNISKSTKNMLMKVEGISNDGLPFYRIFQIPVN